MVLVNLDNSEGWKQKMTVFIMVLVSGLVLGCVYGLIALGYSLIYKASGMMNFSQGDTLTLGAFLGYTLYCMLGLPYWLAAILTVLGGFCLGFAIERFAIRNLVKKNVTAIYVVLATIAISYIIQNTTQAVWTTKMLSYGNVFSISSIPIMGVSIQAESVLCVVISVICMIALHIFMGYSRFGKAMKAAALDPKAAQACGINTSLCTGVTWGIAAGIATLAGILLGPVYGVYIALGTTIGRKGFAGAVVGGYGNMYGAIVGGIALGLVETFTASYISSVYKDLVAYGILLLCLLIRPTGLFNERAITE